MMERPSVVEFVTDSQLLGLTISPAQEALLRAAYGLPLIGDHLDLYRTCTGRTEPPAGPCSEVTVVAGARAGKDSRIAAPIACYEALFGGHETHLHKGERGVIPLVAQDQRATRVAFGYVRDYLTRSPLLASMVDDVLVAEIALRGGLAIYCFACTMRSLRGWSIPAGVLDELAFFRLEGDANTDAEVQGSIRRGMVGFPATKLVKISTPYMRSGILWEDFKAGWGREDPDRLVWRSSSVLMNPGLAERLERERRLDPGRYGREYDAEFSEDLDAFLPAAWVDAAVVADRHELAPRAGVVYTAGADTSGGGSDAFTFAIVHVEGTGAEARVVQDVMRGWGRIGAQAPDLVGVVREVKGILTRYGLHQVIGDAYGAGWLLQECQRQGVAYSPTAPEKSVSYLECEPYFAQGRVELLDHPTLARELKILERRAPTSGRPKVDHPRGGHDDYANALCVAVARAVAELPFFEVDMAKATILGPPRTSYRAPTADLPRLPRHSDESTIPRINWDDSPWGRSRES